MGNTSGSASGSGMSQTQQQGLLAAGSNMQQSGMQQNAQQEALLNRLALSGPPPMMNTAPAPTVGADILGKYKGSMKPPGVNYRSRMGAQLDPTVGQMLTGAA